MSVFGVILVRVFPHYGDSELTDWKDNLDLNEPCFQNSSQLTITEKCTPYYICKCVYNKGGIVCGDANEK